MLTKEFNVEKLHHELAAAGLEISGVTSEGRIDWKSNPTSDQIALAEKVMSAHIPVSQAEALRRTYQEKGLGAETLLYALWEKIMDNDPTSADQIQALMVEIKAKTSIPE